MILHSFFSHPSLCLATKINLLKKPLSSFNPANSYFSVYSLDLLKQLLLNLIDTFFHYQLETNNFSEKKYNSNNYSIFLNFAELVIMSLDQLGYAGQIKYWKRAMFFCQKVDSLGQYPENM